MKHLKSLIPTFLLMLSLLALIPSRANAQNEHPNFFPLVLKLGSKPYQYFMPLVSHGSQPLHSTSYYMKTVEESFLFDLGCELGTRDQQTPGTQDSVVVLDFSYPVCPPDGSLGAELFGFGPVPINDIGTAVKNFGLGYYACTSSDHTSNLVVGIGTNNKPYSCSTPAEAGTHGSAWAVMVNDVNAWFIQQGIFHQVQAYGASDMELGWNGPQWTRAWLDAYDNSHQYPMLHFGDAAGCPYDEKPYWNCGTSSYPEWESEDVWYISWGSPPALPLPLIYLTNGIHAKQWAYLSQYGVNQHGARMDFTGVFTQYQACQQWGCNGTDNTPEEAYIQLLTALREDPSIRQSLRWKTDIRWILNNELPTPSLSGSGFQTEATSIIDQIESLKSASLIPDLSPILQLSIEEKIQTFTLILNQSEASNRSALTKDRQIEQLTLQGSDPPFVNGIFPGGDSLILPLRASVTTTYQTMTDNGYLQIVAGESPLSETQGALYVIRTSHDKGNAQMDIIFAPEDTGRLIIDEEMKDGLLIRDTNGKMLLLDLETLSLVDLDHEN